MTTFPYYPLIIEKYPDEYTGLPFVTLIQYDNINWVSVVDNMIDGKITAYIIDLCASAGLSEEYILSVCDNWHRKHSDEWPLSIEFGRLGIERQMSKTYRQFMVDKITRLVGPVREFPMTNVQSIKKRRCRIIPSTVVVHE
jgi:hypothetical protein